MKELKFKWPFGDFRGQNIYEFSKTEDGKLYCYASRRDLKKDLLAIKEGRYIFPWGKHKGKLIKNLNKSYIKSLKKTVAYRKDKQLRKLI